MTYAFTGHRPSKLPFGYDESHPRCIALKQAMAAEVARLVDLGVTTFLSGMALGVDMWGAELVLEMRSLKRGMRLVAVLPCPGQSDRWAWESRVKYHRILRQCNEVVMVNPAYYRGCMLARDQHMIDRADGLIAVYTDGATGGTAFTIEQASKKGIPVVIIRP